MWRSVVSVLAVFLGNGSAHAEESAAPVNGIVISAAELCPADDRANQPEKGKWWLNRDAQEWGVAGGAVLMTGKPNQTPVPQEKLREWQVLPASYYTPYRVPALEIDPKASGWHRIYVGLYHEPGHEDQKAARRTQARLLAKLTGEPYPEFLQAPESTGGKWAEVYWKAADLTGKKIVIEQPAAPMQHPEHGFIAGLSHIRLAPMDEAAVQAARQELTLPPPAQRLFGMLDYTDEFFWWGRIDAEDDVRASVYRHQQAGFGRIYWRCWGSHLDNSLDVPEARARWSDADEARWRQAQNCQAGWMPYLLLPKKFDPLKVAVEYGKEIGVEVHAWVRFTNLNRPPYCEFWHKNPQFRAQMLSKEKDPATGRRKRVPYGRVLSLAYPEVRAFYVQFFEQLASTGTPGIMIDLLRHPPIAGYEPIVAEAFQEKYGIDMETLDVYHDPTVNEHLSQYLELFLRDLRERLGKRTGPKIEISVRSSGPEKYSLRGKDWIASGLINTIVDGNWYSGNGPRPTIDATVAAAGTQGRAYAIAEPSDVDPKKGWQRRPGGLSSEAILALSKVYHEKGVHRFGVYESTEFTWYPDIRRTLRQAAWSDTPKEK